MADTADPFSCLADLPLSCDASDDSTAFLFDPMVLAAATQAQATHDADGGPPPPRDAAAGDPAVGAPPFDPAVMAMLALPPTAADALVSAGQSPFPHLFDLAARATAADAVTCGRAASSEASNITASLPATPGSPTLPAAPAARGAPPALPERLPVGEAARDSRPDPGKAVEACRQAAEDFANRQVNERKRKAGEAVTDDEKDAADGDCKRARARGEGEGEDDGEGDAAGDRDEAGAGLRPEDVSHRKYQKRLQKNRNSAFVSRIRRREYTRILEESLAEKESQANEYASAYNKVRAEYDNVCAELAALREAARSRAVEFGRAITRPVGEAHAVAGAGAGGNSGTSSTAVVTMFMFALMFGIMLPDMRDRTSASSPVSGTSGKGGVGSRTSSLVLDAAGNPLVLPAACAAKREERVVAGLADTCAFSSGLPSGKMWGGGEAAGAAVDVDAVSEPDSACPTMVDMDGDLVSDCDSVTSRRLVEQLARNASQLLGAADAKSLVQRVERKVASGVLSAHALSLLAKKSAVAALDEPAIHARTAVKREDEVQDDETGQLAVPLTFATLLRQLTLVADHRLVAEIHALIAYKLIPSESHSKRAA